MIYFLVEELKVVLLSIFYHLGIIRGNLSNKLNVGPFLFYLLWYYVLEFMFEGKMEIKRGNQERKVLSDVLTLL